MAKNFVANIVLGGKINPSLKKALDYAGKTALKTSNMITKTNKALNSSMQAISRSTRSIVTVTKRAAAVGAVVTGAAVLGGKAMLDQAANMEQYRNTLNILMKDNKKAAETFKWAIDYANRTPFETDEIVQATVKLQSYGLEAQKVLPLIGDMAASMGKSMDQAVEAIADAQMGELERLKEFGIKKETIIEQANKKLAGIEVVNNKGQITNQRAFNLALLSLMKERYEGGMETQSKTFKGLMSTITGIWKSGLAEMAGVTSTGEIAKGSMFDIIKTKAGELVEKLMQLQEDGTFQKLQQRIGEFTSNAVEKIEELLPKVIDLFETIRENGPEIITTAKRIGIAFLTWKAISGLNSAIQTISGLAGALSIFRIKYLPIIALKSKDRLQTLYLQALYAKDAILMGAKTAGMWAMTAAQGAWNTAVAIGTAIGKAFGAVMAFLTSPIGLVILAITALIAAGYLLWKNWDTISNFLVTIWQQNVVPFFQGIGEWFRNIFSGIGDTFKGFINWVIGGINNLIKALNSVNFKLPDWVPELGGKTFGINIPLIPTFANGGFANSPSIFGEAGLEAAIPIKPKNPRSISLLNQTAKMLGVEPSRGGAVIFNYSPQINGGNAAEIKQILDEDFERFKAYFRQVEHDRGRISYATG